MFRELPRAGTPLGWGDVAAFGSGEELEDAFARWLPARHVHIVSSGRAAQYLILKALRRLSTRTGVVIPAYTCPTVPLAVARAGLTVKLCDVSPQTGNLDPERLEETVTDETLAVIPVHMSGIPCDMAAILDIVRRCGAPVVEDCAQAAGATLNGQKVGTFGDYAFFSLARGKGFTAYEGGIIVCQSEKHAALIQEQIEQSVRLRPLSELVTVAKLLGMALFFHPRLYWFMRALPLDWENEVYSMDFPLRGMGRFRKGVAQIVLGRLENTIEERKARTEYMQERLKGMDGIQLFRAPSGSCPAYPWLGILFKEPPSRDEAYRRLRAAGLGPSRLFTRSLNYYGYLREIVPQERYPGAEYVAARLLTLPTHGYVRGEDMDRMINIVAECLGYGRRS